MYIELAHAKKKRGGGKKRGKRRRGGEEREEEGEEKEERKNARARKKKSPRGACAFSGLFFFAPEPSTSGRISGGPKKSGKGPRRQGGPFLGGTFY